MAARERDWILTTLAVLMGLMALSNFMKPVAQTRYPESTVGFVFFGTQLTGMANAIVGPLFGVWLGVYAWSVWTMRRLALVLGTAYAIYVPVNLVLYTVNPPPGAPPMIFILVYAAVAIGVSGGGALYLWSRRDAFR